MQRVDTSRFLGRDAHLAYVKIVKTVFNSSVHPLNITTGSWPKLPASVSIINPMSLFFPFSSKGDLSILIDAVNKVN